MTKGVVITTGQSNSYKSYAIFAWVAVGILLINTSYFVGEEVGGLMFEAPVAWLAIIEGFTIGMVNAAPSLMIATALASFAKFFSRCSEGHAFTEQNIKALREGGNSLLAAASWDAFLAPIILGAVGEEAGRIGGFTGLALAAGLMGIAILGFAQVLADGVRLQEENEQFL